MLRTGLWALAAFVALMGAGAISLAFAIRSGDESEPRGMFLLPLVAAVFAAILLVLRRRKAQASPWVKRILLAAAALASLALLQPLALMAQHVLLGPSLGLSRFAVLFVIGLGALGCAMLLLGAAIAGLAASRQSDRHKAALEAFD